MHNHCREGLLSRIEQLCEDRDSNLTQLRKLVLTILLESERPLSAYEILDALRQQLPKAAPPTVYRALDYLTEQGFIHKLETLRAYIACFHPEQDHVSQFLICTDCGKVEELEIQALAASLKQAVDQHGFKIHHPVIELTGRCRSCLTAD